MPDTNIILNPDSYKHTHYKMYPPKTRRVGSYLESRRGAEFPRTVFFGLQYILARYLAGRQVTSEKIDEAEKVVESHMGGGVFNRRGWEYIADKHDGRLPVLVRAVPEGSVVPEGNALLTIHNTDSRVPWLTNHLETLLLQVWYPCTVATISYYQRKVLRAALEESGTVSRLPYMLHDFGFRGSTSLESAGIGGMAHLLSFDGTDNMAGMRLASKYYNAVSPGKSVPAAEHSTITAWGRDGELDAYRHILNQFPKGTVSIVSDSWDITHACRVLYGEKLRDDIVKNSASRHVVIRPDSGVPIISILNCLDALAKAFGHTVNDKGYKVLKHVSILQGDGITYRSLPQIARQMLQEKWSLDNVVFGSGGGLLQDCTRDTQRFAIKCSWADVGGEVRDVYKDPKSDPTKKSLAGVLKLVKNNCEYSTVRDDAEHREMEDLLVPVFHNGTVRGTDFADIRSRLNANEGGEHA